MKQIIRGGKVYDGTASEPFLADIFLEDDRIAAVIPRDEAIPEGFKAAGFEDAEVTDITGLSIAPGFFDAHSHNDWFAIRKEPLKYFEPFIRQGITSFITGNCGLSATGFEPGTEHIGVVGAGLFGYSGSDELTGTYPSVREYLAAVDGHSPCNIAVLVGHCTARAGVKGNDSGALSEDEMKRMLQTMEKGLREGACGLSLGLMYKPGLFAPKEELRKVAELCAKFDKPLTVHARALSKVSMDYPLFGRPHLLRALDELVEVTSGLKMKFQYSHAIFVGRKSFKCKDELHAILDRMREEGTDAMFDIYSELLGVSVITVIMPTWYQALSHRQMHSWWNKLRLSVLCKATIILLGMDWSDIQIAYLGPGGEKWEGKSVADCAREMGRSCVSAYLELCEMSNFNGRVNMGPYSTPEIIEWQSRRPDVLYMTDAWVEDHGVQNPAIYDCFPKFLRSSLLGKGDTLPATVRKMSGAVADRFGIRDRGYIRGGAFADLTVFDEKELAQAIPDRERPFGIRKVWINGRKVLDEGRLDEAALRTSGRAMKA